jgi:hypothetical protein
MERRGTWWVASDLCAFGKGVHLRLRRTYLPRGPYRPFDSDEQPLLARSAGMVLVRLIIGVLCRNTLPSLLLVNCSVRVISSSSLALGGGITPSMRPWI